SWFASGSATIDRIPELSTFSEVLKTANISTAADSPYDTIFAPTDEAIASLPAGVLDDLLADPAALADVLKYHIINADPKASGSNWWTADALEERKYKTALEGSSVQIQKSEGGIAYNTHYAKSGTKVMVNDATVLDELDSSASSVIIIDKVLIPVSDLVDISQPGDAVVASSDN
ncbi:MAG: fasciclin domain-containing protein, partial [Candidatus Thalassarchaeaceae archaeon]|nr:fasciclin domain-containing protein [Candidatus Thalassarchaeaceae archaeon]